MRTGILICLLSILCLSTCSRSHNQDVLDENKTINMLRDFYLGYHKIWRNHPTSESANILHEKIDSFTRKYCTEKVRNEAKQYIKFGHDIFTKDYGIDSLGCISLKVYRDHDKTNSYIITYNILDDIVPNILQKEVKVVINILVIKEQGVIKIDEIN